MAAIRSIDFLILTFCTAACHLVNGQTYEVVGELTVGRYGHTATLLPTLPGLNPVAITLIAGGSDGVSVLANAELNGEIIPMSMARIDHTATFISGNDRVLLAGGYDGDITNHSSCEFFNPQTSEFENAPAMIHGRSNHRATALPDGRVLISGGFDGSVNLAACEIYDPVTNLFFAVASMNQGRSSHTATLLPDGRVFVTGGFNPDFGFQMATCEIYDPSSDVWTMAAPMSEARDNHAAAFSNSFYDSPDAAVVVSGGRFYNGDLNLFEGLNSVEIFRVSTGSWESISPMQTGHSYHEMFEASHYFFVPGGADHTGFEVEPTFGVFEYADHNDPDWTDVIAFQEPFISGRFQYAAVITESGSDIDIYTFGGTDAFGYNQTIDRTNFHLLNVNDVQATEVVVFPNPTASRFVIRTSISGAWHVAISDASGREIKSLNFTGNEMVVRDVPSGLYQVVLSMDQHCVTKRILIQE